MGALGRDEQAELERIRSLLPCAPPGEVWSGDDAAVISAGQDTMLLTTDLVVEGVHADLELVGLDDLAWKALVSSVSDVAAMAGRPTRALVGIAAPPRTDMGQLYAGLLAAADRYRCPIVGGDLSNADVVVVSVTLTGTTDGHRAVLRSGASPGDTLFVTGPLGASSAGLAVLRSASRKGLADRSQASSLSLAHRRPTARVEEGRAARESGATAMIDVSDGLGADLDHLGRSSQVGVRVGELPVAAGASAQDALSGGEDYELIFSAPYSRRVEEVFASAGLRAPIVIGSCTADAAERRLGADRLDVGGYQHRWGVKKR